MKIESIMLLDIITPSLSGKCWMRSTSSIRPRRNNTQSGMTPSWAQFIRPGR